MNAIIRETLGNVPISREKAHQVLLSIGNGELSEAEIASFLTANILKGVTVKELEGFRDALLELAHPVDLSEFGPLDLCGTGGDGKNSFNISTLAAFVVAGAGGKVAKHGNYGVSSAAGSSNVLEELGYSFSNDPDTLKRELDQVGITFLHAPLFHPAMKEVAPVRKALGVKTFFNVLGPLVNPADPPYQLVGVFDLPTFRSYQYFFERSDRSYAIVHSLDGYDEISLTGTFRLATPQGVEQSDPRRLTERILKPEELHGGDSLEEAARIFLDVLKGNGTHAQNEAVVTNAALAINTYSADPLEEDLEKARESLRSGKAYAKFQALTQKQQTHVHT
jgi:anthranilate phosphoribosyltransferase